MSANHSHHFVPRCYLKNFSPLENGATINLFNIGRNQLIENAPIKSQCARTFLYGKDELEKILSEIEGKYAAWITRSILRDKPIVLDEIDHFIRFFLMLQFTRTEASAIRTRAHFMLLDKLGQIGIENELSEHYFDTSDKEMVRFSMRMTDDLVNCISDLSVCFIKNTSESMFVTCDDPVVSSNRLHIQRLDRGDFGFGTAGAILYLPLSPEVAVIAYDKDVYSCKKKSTAWAIISNCSDVDALNDLVFLKAKENIYFRSKSDFKHTDFERIKSRRIQDWGEGTIAIPVGERDGGRIFKAVSENERPEVGGFLIHTSQRNPKPYRWPKVLSFKQSAHAYTNGSSAGYIRKRIVKTDGIDAVKIKV